MSAALIEESKMYGAQYANYQPICVGEAIYDSSVCKAKSGVVIPASMQVGCSKHSSGSSSLMEKITAAKDVVAHALSSVTHHHGGHHGGEHGGHHGGDHSGHAEHGTQLATMRSEMDVLRAENQKLTDTMNTVLQKMAALELRMAVGASPSTPRAAAPKEADDDEDIDLFGSESEEDDEEAEKLKKERLAAYAAKKSKKPGPIAKSSILLDVKPWDDETDMKAMEANVRKIEQDGLLWGAAKLVAIGYGIKKLQILCIVEDDKVSVDELTEKITDDLEEFVQSVDIAAFNKI